VLLHGRASFKSLDPRRAWRLDVGNDIGLCWTFSTILLRTVSEKGPDGKSEEVPLADFLPYSTHVTDHVIKTRENDFLRIWRIAGM
jgi:hypothetical protein